MKIHIAQKGRDSQYIRILWRSRACEHQEYGAYGIRIDIRLSFALVLHSCDLWIP